MLALSIRQPYAEEILRGIKTVEYRSRPTAKIEERFYIYAAKKWPGRAAVDRFCKLQWTEGELPTGVIVGTAKISHCTQGAEFVEWHLTDVKRLANPLNPARHPQPIWFRPF
jgi:hypothetical protein